MSPDEKKDQETEALEASEKVKADEQPKKSKAASKAKPKPKAETKAKPAKPKASAATTEDVEEKPKPKAKAKPKAAAKPKAPAGAKQDEATEENEAEAAEAAGEPTAEDAQGKPRGRRGGAAAAGSTRRGPKRRPTDGPVYVRAQAKYVRTAPRKARLVIDHIRGKSVGEARAILTHTPRAASRDVLKLLDSAIANAENNHELVADELKIGKAFVDEGPTLKRFRPRAQGRATRIRKRTSHMTIHLTVKE
jgi:ribosomal protein L22